jgi:hypothetical protein
MIQSQTNKNGNSKMRKKLYYYKYVSIYECKNYIRYTAQILYYYIQTLAIVVLKARLAL